MGLLGGLFGRGLVGSVSLTHCALPDCSITKFLNRILGLEVDKQNMLFQYFSDTFDYLIEKDKKEGKYDMGILGMEKGGVATAGVPVPPSAVSLPSTDPETQRGAFGRTFLTTAFSPSTDLAPGVDEIYEESKEVFLTPGHPQDGQVVFYKVGTCLCLVLGCAEGGFARQTPRLLSCPWSYKTVCVSLFRSALTEA